MNRTEHNKIMDIFDKKYRELAFSYANISESAYTWNSYLEHIECKKIQFQTTNEIEQSAIHYEIVNDPSPFGGFILVPKDIAEKILVLGLP